MLKTMGLIIKSVIVNGEKFSLGDTVVHDSDGRISIIGRIISTVNGHFLFQAKGKDGRFVRPIETHSKLY